VRDCARRLRGFPSFDPGANGSGESAFSRNSYKKRTQATSNDRLNADSPEPLAPESNEITIHHPNVCIIVCTIAHDASTAYAARPTSCPLSTLLVPGRKARVRHPAAFPKPPTELDPADVAEQLKCVYNTTTIFVVADKWPFAAGRICAILVVEGRWSVAGWQRELREDVFSGRRVVRSVASATSALPKAPFGAAVTCLAEMTSESLTYEVEVLAGHCLQTAPAPPFRAGAEVTHRNREGADPVGGQCPLAASETRLPDS